MLLAVALAAPAPAPAAEPDPPQIDQPPVVTGTPQVGATVIADGAEWNRGTATWQWMRCEDTDPRTCRAIPGATATSYAVGSADLGKRLRVLLTVRDRGGVASALSATSAVVTPVSLPDPEPSPEPAPSPVPVPVTQPAVPPAPAAQALAPAGAVRQRHARSVRMMDPAPIVRIRGRLTRSGARITLLTVRAPRGARTAVRCFGRGCPARRWAGIAALTRVVRFQRAFPAGARLVISVTKPGRIGKHTTIVIRRGAAPMRRDRCLMPGARTPTRCPEA